MEMISPLVIAAAGRGTRMGALTADQPKHLIVIAGKPFLSFVLEAARKVGFRRIIVVIGYQAQQMRDFLSNQPVAVEVVDQSAAVSEKYGTAAAALAALDRVGDEPFVFQNGDAFYTEKLLRQAMVNDGYTHVYGVVHEHPEEYGVMEVAPDGFLLRIVEKPQQPKSHIINMGLYTFQREIGDPIRSVKPSARGEYELTDAVNALALHSHIKMDVVENEWITLGTLEDIRSVESFLSFHHLV